MNAFDKPKEQYLRKLFDPKTIAVVGASPDTSKGGYRPLRFLPHHGFTGRVYPVNPKYEQIGDLKCYPTVLDIPDALDAVMITLPENLVLGVLKDCLEKGVKLAIIRTAFEEFFDGDQTKAQKKVAFLELIRGKGLRIMGPSSLGFVNVHRQIAAYFHVCLSMERLVAGNIGLVSQSGGLSGVIFNKAQDYGVGFSYFFSTGVETDLETADFIDFLVDDPDTKVISCFVEGFNDPQRILATFGKAGEANKPIIIMKIGRSELGMKAAKSHTGKMVGKDEIWNAIFKQKGIIRVETIDELVETCSLFAKCKNPRNDKMGIMAASGGAATILTDQMGFYKLNLPDLNTYTRTKLREILPSYASINNPLDVSPIGDEGYLKCLEIFSEDNNFGTILLPLTIVPEDFGAKRAREIVQFQKSIDKQVIILWLGGSLVSRGMKIIEESEIPLFRSETICVKALRAYKDYLRFQNLRQTSPDLEIPETDQELFEVFIDREGISEGISYSKTIFTQFGILVAREGVANSVREAIDLAHSIGYPVVLKALSSQMIHKTEFGAVRLNIKNDKELEEQYFQMINFFDRLNPQIEITGVLVQEMILDGTEVILGMYQDPELGPITTCGLGGVFTEILRDIAFRIPPFNSLIAREMIEELKGFEVLKGFRKKKKLDINALIETIVRFSWLCTLLKGRAKEVEINPLILQEEGKGVKAVDTRILWK